MSEPFVAKVKSERLHTALKVKSLDDSVSFYHGVMGLPILMEVGQPGNPRTIFLPGIQLVRQGDAEITPGGRFDHVGIPMENLEEVCARLDAAGYQAEVPLERRVLEGVNLPILLCFYRDPDGNRLELFRFL